MMRVGFIVITVFWAFQAATQQWDLGLSLGGANYNGDLSENWKSSLKSTHPYLGVHARLSLDPFFSLRILYARFTLSGSDSYSTNESIKKRNLSFSSDMSEWSLTAQVQVLDLFSYEPLRCSPFLQLGLGIVYFNPRTYYQGTWVSLQPLGTEGQGLPNYKDPYALHALCGIMGGGLRFALSSNVTIAMEYVWRLSASDYIDDASGYYVSYSYLLQNKGRTAADLGNKIDAQTGDQRANPKSNDGYQSFSFSVNFHLGKNNYFKNSLYKKPVRCPVF